MKAILTGIVLFCAMKGYSQNAFTVHFEFNKYTLTTEAMRQLDSFLLANKESQKGYIIGLDGHCDAVGTNDYNKALSLKRVSAVKKYLLHNNIDPVEVSTATGHGEQSPLNENKTEEERQLNRRVEVSLMQVVETHNPGTEQLKTLLEKIADTASVAGTHIVLKNMNFYGGTPFLLPESFSIVDELLQAMRVNPKLVIEIQGHICCVATSGDSRYGATGNGLSEERARMIYAELIGKGIEASRVSYKGFGHSMPIYPYPEQTEEERIANRRVEIKIISK